MGATVTAGAKTRIPDAFREFLLLEQAQRSAQTRSADQEARIRDFLTAADSRLAAAEVLTGGDQVPAALTLYREAIVLTIGALLADRGLESSEPTAENAFERLATLLDAGEIPPAPSEFQQVQALLSDSRLLVFDGLSATDALEKRTEVEAVAIWLRGLVDSRTVQQIKWSRATRLGGIALGVFALVTWGVIAMLSPKNIALGKPVQLSSRRPNCPPTAGEAGLAGSGLVDGLKGATYDICTNYEVHPWATIDLQKVRSVSKVIVYDRGDCCWGAYDLPSVLDISDDGTNFTEIARRTTPYTATDPWVIKLERKAGRFIRLRVDSNDPKELVLTEVEVYSPKW